MHKSTRIQPINDPKGKQLSLEDLQKDTIISKKSDIQNKPSKTSIPNTKVAEKKEPEPTKYMEPNFSQESQNIENLEKRVELIIEEAVLIENEYGKTEKDEEIKYMERMQTIEMKLNEIFQNYANQQAESENLLNTNLTRHFQNVFEKMNEMNQTLENSIEERNNIQLQTTNALRMTVSLEKYLKENRTCWNLN